MSKLLINEHPLLVLPALAKAIGLNEALFAQQLHYWINSTSSSEKNGRRWTVNTLDQWCANFPFWSKSTVQRIIASLRKNKIIEIASFNTDIQDRTSWYTINYDVIDAVENGSFAPEHEHTQVRISAVPSGVEKSDMVKVGNACGQSDHMPSGQSDQIDVVNLTRCLSIKETSIENRLERELNIETPGSATASPALDKSSVDKSKPIPTAIVDVSGKETKPDSKNTVEEALSSFEAYAKYMKLQEIYAKPLATWDAKDFVKFFYCGMAKHSGVGVIAMPIWGKDAKIMQVYLKKYTAVNLHKIIVTLCKRKADVERACRRSITLSMSIFAIPWIMSEVEKIAFGVPEQPELTATERILAQREAEQRASEIRNKLQNGVKST